MSAAVVGWQYKGNIFSAKERLKSECLLWAVFVGARLLRPKIRDVCLETYLVSDESKG